jgi:hypothetical protein
MQTSICLLPLLEGKAGKAGKARQGRDKERTTVGETTARRHEREFRKRTRDAR